MAKKKTPAPETGTGIKKRIWLVAVILGVVGFGILIYRLGILQLRDYEKYRALATGQQLSDTIVEPNRGTIYDCNMNVLAKSSTVWTVSAAPNVIKDENVEATAKVLSEVLELDYDTVLEKLNNRKSQYQIIKKKIEKDVADELRKRLEENGLNGINLTQDSKRYYPYGDFASYVLGFVGGDNQGLEGVEYYYDDELTGTPGRIVSAQNAWGLNMPYEYAARYPSTDGNSLKLTIDETIQHSLEKNLDYAVKAHNVSQKGMGIVMNAKTGAILAMDVKPSYDPNSPYTIVDTELAQLISEIQDDEERSQAQAEARQAQWRNKAVSDQYEPGSVFKIVTASAALDTGVCTVNTPFYCSGSINVSGVTIHCAHTEGHGGLTFATALINSCNPSFIEMGQRLGKDVFYDYFNAFGLTEKTGIDLPGEAGSSYYTPDQMGPVELASCSFGQSSKVTALQMITAVATAVNGGKLVQPHIVSQILDPQGNVLEDINPEPKRQVISAEVSQQICEVLAENVANGQGVNAYVMGYRVGGKSGTSQKLDSDDPDARIASFVGFAPADDPEIVVLIVLDEPHSYNAYGGQLCAPVVGQVIRESLPHLGIEPQYTDAEIAKINARVPNCTGVTVTAGQVSAERNGFATKLVGTGAYVVSQYPNAGTEMPKGSTVVLYTEEGMEQNLVTVPNVVGMPMSSAISVLQDAGLNVIKEGTSNEGITVFAASQSIEENSSVPEGTVITVSFRDESITDDVTA